MMDYNTFKMVVASRIKDHLPAEFRDYEVETGEFYKVNGRKEFLRIVPSNPSGTAIPTLYFDDLYEDFMKWEDLDTVLYVIANLIVNNTGAIPETDELLTLENHLDKVVPQLIGAKRNEEFLKTVPHTNFLDMAVIYRYVIKMDEEGFASAVINNDVAEDCGLKAEDLHKLAMENAGRILPTEFIEVNGACVMTNEQRWLGATTMLHNEDMKQLSKRMGGDFYIMPTSLHEFFAISLQGSDVDKLRMMLEAGNRDSSMVDESEVLSDSIYRYDAESGEVVFA